MLVIDGENCILGRLSAYVAKELIKGEQVVIVNAEKIVLTGNPLVRYKKRSGLRDIAKPVKSPKLPLRPDLFVKRAIRGMLPFRTARGRDAYRRIIAYMGIPEEYEGKGKRMYEWKGSQRDIMTVEAICKKLGWS